METFIHYKKNKNKQVFLEFEKYGIKEIQNYIPLYKLFFSLNDKNYNSINLNHPYTIQKINSFTEENSNIMNCTIQDQDGKHKNKAIFLKKAPLLDPFYYIMGKYKEYTEDMYLLPQFNNDNTKSKVNNSFNSAYVDGFFSYLTNQLYNQYNIVHGNEFYGSFVGYDTAFKLNVIEDLDYLVNSEYFVKNQNVLFQIDDYSYLFSSHKLPPIKISSAKEDYITLDDIDTLDKLDIQEMDTIDSKSKAETLENMDCEELAMLEFDPVIEGIEDENEHEHGNGNGHDATLSLYKSEEHSESTYSSRSSHTTDEEDYEMDISDEDDGNDEESTNSYSTSSLSSNTSSCHDKVFITLPNFPVHLICTEKCEETLDYLIKNDLIKKEEWFAILLQVIFTLIIYQKCFQFTHNDLHTENIMYVSTKEPYLYYTFNKKKYKVPTFGKVFKIIDFGRAIYKVKGHTICSDEFKTGGNAHGQYNCEPFFNCNKPRIDPNYSFDLCRLACCIFDYFIDDLDELPGLVNKDPVFKLINEWCRDDNNLLINYKQNGKERYSGFKYYKMIVLKVHKHLPILQLHRPEFKKFEVKTILKGKTIMDIDTIPVFI